MDEPQAVASPTKGARRHGRPAPRLRLFAWVFAGGLLCCLLAFAALWLLTPDPTATVLSRPVSPVLLDDKGRIINARLSSKGEWCIPVPLEKMGHWLPKVLVAVEDKRFYDHGGVDFLALGRAAYLNLTHGRVRSGASTITSQLVRLSTPRDRTFGTKILEFFGAWKLERSLTKDQILEQYLNQAPFGGPIRGVEAAARLYFGKRAEELSLGEAALLVGLLKGPTAYRPDKNPVAAQKRRRQIIAKVAEQTGFPPDLTELALKEPLPDFRPVMPGEARHFADLAFITLAFRPYTQPGGVAPGDMGGAGPMGAGGGSGSAGLVDVGGMSASGGADGVSAPGGTRGTASGAGGAASSAGAPPAVSAVDPTGMGGVVRSTLNRETQALLERTLLEQLVRSAPDTTAAGIVVDNRTASIVAYVGNARFDAAAGREWVDCALAARSPGSTLKPFVYLAAMERGKIIPASLLADTPIRLGGDAPRNFDRRRRGPVSAATALADSLNIPAVRVQRMVGLRACLTLLRQAGFSHLNRDDEAYGDSLVLGAGEVSLLELARAYTTLANLGLDRPLTLLAPGADVSGTGPLPAEARPPAGLASREDLAAGRLGRQLHTQAGAFLIAEILKDPGRLPFIMQLTQARENAPIAFKTGTSYGLRDAWTAAYTPRHTVVLWFGKAAGGPDNTLLGLSMAAPGAIRILRELDAGAAGAKNWYPRPADVTQVSVCALSGQTPSPYCPSVRKAYVIESVRRTVTCDMHKLRNGKVEVVWPPELEDFQKMRLVQEDLSRPAYIVSPLSGAEYLLPPGVRAEPLPLKADGVVYPVHWYMDGEYLGVQNDPGDPLYCPPLPGKHRISLLDAQDRTADVDVTVVDLAGGVEEKAPLLW